MLLIPLMEEVKDDFKESIALRKSQGQNKALISE